MSFFQSLTLEQQLASLSGLFFVAGVVYLVICEFTSNKGKK